MFQTFFVAWKNNEFDDSFTLLMVLGLPKDAISELFRAQFPAQILDLFLNSISDLLCGVIFNGAVLQRLLWGGPRDPTWAHMAPKSSPKTPKDRKTNTPAAPGAPLVPQRFPKAPKASTFIDFYSFRIHCRSPRSLLVSTAGGAGRWQIRWSMGDYGNLDC